MRPLPPPSPLLSHARSSFSLLCRTDLGSCRPRNVACTQPDHSLAARCNSRLRIPRHHALCHGAAPSQARESFKRAIRSPCSLRESRTGQAGAKGSGEGKIPQALLPAAAEERASGPEDLAPSPPSFLPLGDEECDGLLPFSLSLCCLWPLTLASGEQQQKLKRLNKGWKASAQGCCYCREHHRHSHPWPSLSLSLSLSLRRSRRAVSF